MATREKKPSEVTTGVVMIGYVNLFKPYVDPEKPDEAPKYKCLLYIPKKDKETVAKIKAAIKHCEEKMIAEKYAGKRPKMGIKNTLRDGDAEKDEPEYEGMYYMNVSSNRRPPVVDRRLIPISESDKVYSGCFCRVSLNFFYYFGKESKGITAGLEGVQFVRDGERLGGGGISAEDAFGDDYEFEDDEDYDDSEEDDDYDL